jgi:hypothetical protein
MGIQTIPHANKNSSIRVQEENLREKTHTLAYINKNWQKRHANKKEKKTYTVKPLFIVFGGGSDKETMDLGKQ